MKPKLRRQAHPRDGGMWFITRAGIMWIIHRLRAEHVGLGFAVGEAMRRLVQREAF